MKVVPKWATKGCLLCRVLEVFSESKRGWLLRVEGIRELWWARKNGKGDVRLWSVKPHYY